jgi:hypothetical protein
MGSLSGAAQLLAEGASGRPVDNASYDWTSLLQRLQLGGAEATQELDFLFGRGIRYFFRRRLQRNDVEREVCDTFSMVIQSIRRGEVRESHRLASHILTHARLRAVVSPTDSVSERSPKPISRTAEAARHLLASLTARDRDILERFYVKEQPAEQICADLHITYPELQLLKSNAKSKFMLLTQGRKQASQESTS